MTKYERETIGADSSNHRAANVKYSLSGGGGWPGYGRNLPSSLMSSRGNTAFPATTGLRAACDLTTITTPAGRTIGFGYDPSGRVTSVSRYTTLGQNSGDAAVTGFGYAPNPDGSGSHQRLYRPWEESSQPSLAAEFATP